MNKQKKIATITCHNVYNHGASLQEYALLQYLSNLGYETETINYTPDYLSGHFNLLSVDNPRFKKNIFLKLFYILLKLPIKLFDFPRKKKFDAFSNEYIKTSTKQYKHYRELKKNPPEADIYICGSDQIWNSYFQNGKDPAFYLDFVPPEKLKISYAPSFAIEEIEDSLKDFVKEKVEKIDAVSVRESSGQRILSDLGISNVKQVLDPVFLLNEEEWKKIASNVREKKYVLVYDFDNNLNIKKIAEELKIKNGLQIIALNKNVSYADKKYFHIGPNEFLGLLLNADFVLANSFHALAFSLIFKKNFVVFNRNDKINTRMRDLLKLLHLEERMFDHKNFDYKKEIDYRKITNLLEEQIKKSKGFLKDSLIIEKSNA